MIGFTSFPSICSTILQGRSVTTRFHGLSACRLRKTGWPTRATRSQPATGVLALRAAQNESGDDDLPTVTEPYPGYFRDMERMGISQEEAVAQLRAQMAAKRPPSDRKIGGKASLYRPDGTPYAPWMIGLVEEEPSKVSGQKARTDARGRLAGDPQAQEIAGIGLRARVVDNTHIELVWRTENEMNNAGFQVSRRKGKSTEWEVIADYKNAPDDLRSKGPQGGAYRLIDQPPEPSGTWLYRVSDVDNNGVVSDLSQVLVEFETEEERRRQLLVLAALLGTLLVIGVVTSVLDPLSGP
ncbi:hypothetical protein CCYA_CCYA08G2248 [Cyanidiococcus yangmingshanensis]|nr:hypothetical protein CCYA_CCYA08G2248 [Cyanidiococcus yangmingshanensis]